MDEFVLIPATMWNSFMKPEPTVSSKIAPLPEDVPPPKKKVKVESMSDRITSQLTNFHVKKKKNIVDALLKNDRIESSPRDTIILDSVDTGIGIREFAETFVKETKDGLPPIFNSILSVLNLPSQSVRNKNALEEGFGDWIATFRK